MVATLTAQLTSVSMLMERASAVVHTMSPERPELETTTETTTTAAAMSAPLLQLRLSILHRIKLPQAVALLSVLGHLSAKAQVFLTNGRNKKAEREALAMSVEPPTQLLNSQA